MTTPPLLGGTSTRHVSVFEEAVETMPLGSSSNVQKRNYILNDSNALKKKVKHETRSEPYNEGIEARDG